jgi:hypothetical protein
MRVDGEARPVFVIGTGRCGSTLVQELLAKHSDVSFISNVDTTFPALNSKGRWNNPIYRRFPRQFASRDTPYLKHLRFTLRERLHYGPSEAYALLGRQVSPLVSSPHRDLTADDVTPWLARRLREFVSDRVRAQRRPVFLHKFTGWPRAGFLKAIFPQAKFIHVVRDGRAVASSLVQRPWWKGYLGVPGWGFGALPEPYEREWKSSGYSYVVLAGLEWKVMMDAFDVAKTLTPQEDWMDLRYEDFVEAPRRCAEALVRFSGLSWNEAFDREVARRTFSRARLGAYEKDLTPAQLTALERVLSDHLRIHGYSTNETAAGKLD